MSFGLRLVALSVATCLSLGGVALSAETGVNAAGAHANNALQDTVAVDASDVDSVIAAANAAARGTVSGSADVGNAGVVATSDAASKTAKTSDVTAQQLPDTVDSSIPDDATLVSPDLAVTKQGEVKDVETGETVTDPSVVGTQDTPPDPLDKTDGKSYIPVAVADVKAEVGVTDKSAAKSEGSGNSNSSQNDSSDSANADIDTDTDTDKKTEDSTSESYQSKNSADDADLPDSQSSDDSEVANGSSDSANADDSDDSGDASSDSADSDDSADSSDSANAAAFVEGQSQVVNAAQGNQWGAYWGTYNGTQAFFEKDHTLFVQNAKWVVDVSKHNGTIDWQRAKNAGVQGAIIRVGYGAGNPIDEQAIRNIHECKRLGIPFGVYLYSYADSVSFAREEGDSVVGYLRQAGVSPSDLSYPVYYDMEQWSWTGHQPSSDPSVNASYAQAFWKVLENAGFGGRIAIYSYTSYLNSALNSQWIHDRTDWVAQYAGNITYSGWAANASRRGWQYTSSGHIDGIGDVDMSAFGERSYVVTNLPVAYVPNGDYYINSSLKVSSSADIADGSMSEGASLQLFRANASEAQQFNFTRQGDGSYVIRNVRSGKVLDVEGGYTGDGVAVRQWESNGTPAQRWFLRDSGRGLYLQSALGNWVLDVSGANVSDRTRIQLYSPNATDAQRFILASAHVSIPTDQTLKIASATNENMVMDIAGGFTDDQTPVQTFTWNESDAQLFVFHIVGNGAYEIVNYHSGRAVDARGGNTSNGTAVQQFARNSTASQQWLVRDAGAGKVTFIGARSSKALDVPNNDVCNGNHLQLFDSNYTTAQQWYLSTQPTSRQRLDSLAAGQRNVLRDGIYKIRSAINSNFMLDVDNASRYDCANVQLFAGNGTDAQLWRVSHDAQGYVTFTSVASNKVLDVSGGLAAAGSNVQQFGSNGTYAQKWVLQRDNNAYRVISAIDSRYVLDLSNGLVQDHSNIQIYDYNGSLAQYWLIG